MPGPSTSPLDVLGAMNNLIAIYPYKFEGLWVFDDQKVGLDQEPFISGADVILDRMTAQIPNAEKGFRLLFSAAPFPGFSAEFEWRREEAGGNWYYSRALQLEGWLCPALFRYFEAAPQRLYAKFEATIVGGRCDSWRLRAAGAERTVYALGASSAARRATEELRST